MEQPLDKPKPQNQPAEKPVNWQEQFVQNHHSGKPNQPTYESFWNAVQADAQALLKSGPNGGFTRAELAQGITDGRFKGDQALVAGAIYDTFDQVKTGAIKKMLGTARITPKDMAVEIGKIKEGERQFHQVDDLTYWADNQKNLQKYSGDGSGSVTYADVTNALKRKDINGEDRGRLQELESKFHVIAPDGKLGKQDIDAYYNNFAATNEDFKLGKLFLHDMRHVSDAQLDPNSHRLFANEANPIESIKVDGVRQGFAGDCAFKASLAAVVVTRPGSVLNMLKQSGGHLKVDFPGDDSGALTIKPPSDEEIGLYSTQATRGSWASALEKAYGEKVYQEAGAVKKFMLSDKLGAYRAASDGVTQHALQTLTGHKVDVVDVDDLSATQIQSALTRAQNEKRAVVLNTAPGDESTNSRDGFSIGHAFTVIGINAQGDVTVRDPRDHGMNRTDGTMQISVEKLKNNFKQLLFETDQKA